MTDIVIYLASKPAVSIKEIAGETCYAVRFSRDSLRSIIDHKAELTTEDMAHIEQLTKEIDEGRE